MLQSVQRYVVRCVFCICPLFHFWAAFVAILIKKRKRCNTTAKPVVSRLREKDNGSFDMHSKVVEMIQL